MNKQNNHYANGDPRRRWIWCHQCLFFTIILVNICSVANSTNLITRKRTSEFALRPLKNGNSLDEIAKYCPFCHAQNIWPWNWEKWETLVNRVEHRDISFVFDMRTGCKVNFCCNFCDLVVAGSMGEFLTYPMTTQRLIWMKFNHQNASKNLPIFN